MVLAHDMSAYYSEEWPEIKNISKVGKFYDWREAENFIESFGISFRMNEVP